MEKGKGRWWKERRRNKRKEREKRRERRRKEKGIVSLPLELPRRPLQEQGLFFIFFQGKPLNFMPLNPCIMCWDNVRIYFLIYFMKNS